MRRLATSGALVVFEEGLVSGVPLRSFGGLTGETGAAAADFFEAATGLVTVAGCLAALGSGLGTALGTALGTGLTTFSAATFRSDLAATFLGRTTGGNFLEGFVGLVGAGDADFRSFEAPRADSTAGVITSGLTTVFLEGGLDEDME